MSYRRQSRRGPSLPSILVFTGLGVILAGFIAVLFATFLASMISSPDASLGTQFIGAFLIEPLGLLFEGGMVTFGGGFVLTVAGGFSILFSL